jgi:hypothetical protein
MESHYAKQHAMTLQNAAIAAVKSRLPILSAAGLSILLMTSCASL